MAKKPMTLEDLMGPRYRDHFQLPDGNEYLLRNRREVTPNALRVIQEFQSQVGNPNIPMIRQYVVMKDMVKAIFYDFVPDETAGMLTAEEASAILTHWGDEERERECAERQAELDAKLAAEAESEDAEGE